MSIFKKSFFSKQKTSLGAVILSTAYAGSYALGLLRDRTLAYYFTTDIKETYDAAFIIPDLIFNFFAAGLLSAAVFLPVFRELLDRKEPEKANELGSSLLNLMSVTIIVIDLACLILMPYLTPLIAPGFSPEKIALVTTMSRIMLLSPLLFAISNIVGNILYSFQRFTTYAFAVLLYNGSIILTVIFTQGRLGITSAAWGLVLGVFLHLLFRLSELRATSFRYRFQINFKLRELWLVLKLAIPKTLGQLSEQAKLLIFNRVGSLLSSGSLAAFNYARNIQSFPVSLIGISLSSAVFPELSSLVGRNKQAELKLSFLKSFGQILFFSLPAAVGLAYLSGPIVELLLKTGRFSAEDLSLTAWALAFFAISIPTESLLHLLARLFYAHKFIWTPVLTSLLCALLNIFLSYYLAINLHLGSAGMAISFSVYTSLQMLLLLILSHYHLFKLSFGEILRVIYKTFLASTGMLLVLYFVGSFLPEMNIVLKTVSLISIGALSYLVFAFLLKCEELDFMLSKIRARRF